MTFCYKLSHSLLFFLYFFLNLWHTLAQNIHRTEPTDGILLFKYHIVKPTYFKLGNILILYSNIHEKIITYFTQFT